MTGRYRAPPAPRPDRIGRAVARGRPCCGAIRSCSASVKSSCRSSCARLYCAESPRSGPWSVSKRPTEDRSPRHHGLPTGVSSATTARTGFGCMAGEHCVLFWSGLHGNIASLRHCPLFSADRGTLESGAHDVDGMPGCQRLGRRGAGVLCTVRLPYVLRPRTADDDPVDGPAGVADGLLNSIGATRRPGLPPAEPSVTASTKYVNRKSLTLSRNVLASSQRSDGSRPQYTSAVRWWHPWAIRS